MGRDRTDYLPEEGGSLIGDPAVSNEDLDLAEYAETEGLSQTAAVDQLGDADAPGFDESGVGAGTGNMMGVPLTGAPLLPDDDASDADDRRR